MSVDNDDDIPIHTNGLSRLDNGDLVEVAYVSNRSSNEPKIKSGKVTLVELFNDEKGRFRFYDNDSERKLEVVVRETVGESSVKSLKTKTWTTIGSPVRVVMSLDGEMDAHQSYLINLRDDDCTPVLAFAEISWNEAVYRLLNP